MQKKVIQQIREDYSPDNNRKRTLDGYAASIKTLADDLYAKDTHFIFELIQNAEDNTYITEKPSLRFILTKADPVIGEKDTIALIVENNEAGFQEEHVEAICDVGRSTKKKEQGYIGEKGIGFKSVFKVTSCPFIYSNGFHFSLPEKDELSGLGYIVPNWTESIPQKTNNDVTSIFLPLDKENFPVDKVVKSLKDIAPETVIFLKKLKTIELFVDLEDKYEIIIEKDDSEFPLVKLAYFKKNAKKEKITEQFFWVSSKEFDKPEDVHHEKRSNIATRDVSIAIPLGEKRQGKLFAYLPVWEDTGLPFLINADFLLTSSREAVKEDESWNTWLRACISDVYVKALISCLSSDFLTFIQKISSYASLPERTNHKFLQSVVPEIHGQLKNTACVYTAQCDELAVPGSTRIAPKEFWDLIGGGNLPQIFKESMPLVCSELAPYSKSLRALGVPSLTNDDLLECLNDDQWLASKSDDEWFIQLFRFLKDREFEKESLVQKDIVKVWSDKDQVSVLSSDGKNPIYFARDEETRKVIQRAPEWLQNIVPAVFLDRIFFKTINGQEDAIELREWMTEILNVHPFSLANYCIDITNVLVEQYENLSPKKIAVATSFLVDHVDDEFDWDNIPIALNNGSKNFLSVFNSNIIVPERYNRGSGWQHIWVTENDRRHFCVLSNHYSEKTVNYLLAHCNKIKKYPTPEQVVEITYGATNAYEAQCLSQVPYSTREKTISNWRPPSVLKQEVIEDRKSSDSLLSFLSETCVSSHSASRFSTGILGRYNFATVHWFYRTAQTTRSESEFYSKLKQCKWLPTQKGFVRPVLAFLPKQEIKEILGDTVPYCQGNIPEQVIKILGVKTELTIDKLIEILTINVNEAGVNIEMAYRIYSALNTRTSFDDPKDLVEAFTNNKLIFVPQNDAEGHWYTLRQVIWEDSEQVLGDDFTYLQNHYPKLKDFFVNTLGVKEKADPESFAQRWLKLQYDTEKSFQEIRESIESIYRTLLPIAKREQDERPAWWSNFVANALILTQSGKFVDSKEVVVPDDGELKKIFAVTDTEFVWRPEKDSFSQWAPFYRAFNIPNISESVITELVDENTKFTINLNNEFVTESTILMLSSWLREKDAKYYEKLFDDGVFQSLFDLQEAKTDEAIEILFTLEKGYIRAEVEANYPVYWDQQNKILRINKQEKKSEIKRKISTELAKGLMKNRSYKDLSHWIELTLSAVNTERIDDEGWSIPREISKLFKPNTQQPDDETSKNNETTSKEDIKASQPEGETSSSASKRSEYRDTESSQKNSSSNSNASGNNEEKQVKSPVDKKVEKNSDNGSQSDTVNDKENGSADADHGNEDVKDEPVQNDDILEKFEKAFNRNGETFLSEEYEDDDYFNEGTVKNPTRRRERSKAGHRERVINEPNHDERLRETTRMIMEPADLATRAYLLNLYTGKCQICGSTFPQRSGSPFFIAGHIVERKYARLLDDPANTLCLCPQHFAQWRHGKVEAVDIIGQIRSKKTKSEGADDLALTIGLCGEECQIRYKEKHIVDLQAFLETISEI
ncbi:MAG: hypothetical protein KJ804_19785 [Proteobacteria bacterium]|nr:hypothetical protein [Pseudomonadota bacterium]